MNYESLILKQEQSVAVITLNRPDRLNAISLEMADELADALKSVMRAGEARSVMLTGAGRGFCSGADLKAARSDNGRDVDASMRDHYHAAGLLLAECPLPTVAAVNGPAAGAGSSLALLCDIVIAADSAYFEQSFSNIGLVPDTGASWTLTHSLGPAQATALMMLGDRLPAARACELGLIYRCVPDDEFTAASLDLARKLAERPTASLSLIKRLVRHASSNSLRDQMLLEQEFQRIGRMTDDAAEAKLAFREKRRPVFTGR